MKFCNMYFSLRNERQTDETYGYNGPWSNRNFLLWLNSLSMPIHQKNLWCLSNLIQFRTYLLFTRNRIFLLFFYLGRYNLWALNNIICVRCRFSCYLQTNESVISFPGIVKPPHDVHVQARDYYCCNCGRKGHYVHQCRGYSYSKIPPLVLNVVSYKDPLNFGYETEIPTSYESKKERKRRLRDEMKKKRREYLSLPSTPLRSG